MFLNCLAKTKARFKNKTFPKANFARRLCNWKYS